jgi:hypothetical protein
MASTAVYREFMAALEGRRVELGLSMATVNDMAGLQDGFFAKMLYPDTPSGRQARWETVQLAVEALFGKGFTVHIVADEDENRRITSAPVIDVCASANARKIRHWRHSRHFAELGRLGGLSRAKLGKAKLSAIASKAQKKRWKRIRDAKRSGELHKKANAEARTAT